MRRREMLKSGFAVGAVAGMGFQGVAMSGAQSSGGAQAGGFTEDRASWVAMLDRICRPLFEALSGMKMADLMGNIKAMKPREEKDDKK